MTWQRVALFAGIFVGTLALSLSITAVVLVRLPANYFVGQRRPAFEGSHPVLRVAMIFLRNLLGVALVVLGLLLSIPGVPGQGLLTVFLGLMLLDFPGKYRVQRWFIRRRAVSRSANWVRAKFGKPPLEVP